MKALAVVFSVLLTSTAAAQGGPKALDRAYEEARAAYLALREAEARRDAGVAAQEGDRQGTASGGTRPTEQYLGRQGLLEQEVEMARRRYEATLKRWNDLK
ncbi:MAG TPA: hypothetical protein VIQ55_07350 [Burkholderiales bacterium]|jgi:hypothetical protein